LKKVKIQQTFEEVEIINNIQMFLNFNEDG